MQVKDYLYQKDLYLPLVGDKPEVINASEWAISDIKALTTVRLSLTPQVAFNISEEKTTAAVMKALEKLYEKPSASNKKNLISVSGLDREGYFVPFGEKQWKVIKWSMVVARGERVGTLYTLLGMKNIQLDFCEGCVYGKQKHVSFQRDGKEKKIEKLELVHTDVCGPTTVKSLGDMEVMNMVIVCGTTNITKSSGVGMSYSMNHSCISTVYKNMELKKNKEYMELDEPEDGQVPRTKNSEVLDETTDTKIGAGDQQQVPETLNLIRSSQVRKAPDRLCLPFDYILYTDSDDMLVAGSSMGRINELKKKLANTFSMKDLGEAKQLLGMRITRDRKQKKLWLSQQEYIEKVLRRFNFHASKPVTTPLAAHFKLSKELSPKYREDEEYMALVAYSSDVESLMYAMVSTRPNIAHAVGVVSRFMTKPKKGTLASSEVDSQVFERNVQVLLMF
ncbi:hypothetical protein RJ639_013435 [Escallonia herrerae]|uniref:Reverse transcriptase Ty1/copia-type domain-containing protein n=1 Tax=Escallonia herrerae TaxID=1293975 RepID=A0AA88VPK3_9ASTE|nr:hypothetical protein RJ639_013435 [Escallonia herrerae]